MARERFVAGGVVRLHLTFSSMAPSTRNADREKCVKALNKIAAGVDMDRVPNNAGKRKVVELIEAVREAVESSGWTGEDDESDFEQAVLF